MNITINSIDNISVVGSTATGRVSMTINGKHIKSATYTHHLETGRTIFRQNVMIDGFDLRSSDDQFNVEEYCYACEKLQKALRVKTSKFQNYLGLSDIKICLGESSSHGGITTCPILITGYYWVDGERSEINPLIANYSCGNRHQDITFFKDQRPIDRLDNARNWVKAFYFTSMEQLEETLKKELLTALSSNNVEAVHEDGIDVVLLA